MGDVAADTLVSVLERRAREEGAAPFAFFSNAPPLSADEHRKNAERVAGALAAAGVRRGSRVLLLGTTGPELLAGLAASWRVGALACPAEAFLAPEGLRRICEQFRPDLAVIDPDLDSGRALTLIARDLRVPELTLSSAFAHPSAYTGSKPGGDDPALCIFTSGSTGIPKGVVLSQRNLLAGAANVIAAKGIGARDRVLCVLPMSHLNGLETTFVTPLVSGGSVVYLQGPFQPERALRLIDEHQCTWFSAVPTQYAFLLKPPVPRNAWSLKTLRFCRSASAPLPVRVRKEFEDYYGVPIIETMGMTETSGQIFSNPLPPDRPREGSVGRAIGFEVRIVGEGGTRAGPGEVGEIQVRGKAIMLGHLDNPQETARVFDGGWLRSGDLGSVDSDGFYYIRGRIKDIAIFSGVNISLRAIESAVQEAGLVDDVACVGASDEFFGETVIAYVMPPPASRDIGSVAAQVAEKLRGLLPSHQALREVRIVDRFPRNSAGKVLKGRLGESEVRYTTARALSRDPKRLLAEVLHIPEAGVTEDLGLGLLKQWDSLGHVSLVLAVETLLDRVLEPSEIIGITTFRGLAQVLDGSFDSSRSADGDQLLDAETKPDGVALSARERSDLIALMVWNRILPGRETPDEGGRPAGAEQLPRRGSSNTVLTFDTLCAALRNAGLTEGDTVLVHSDVSAIGLTEAGHDREAVLDFYLRAFSRVLGEDGTLAMCTSFEDYGRYGTPFELERSPSRLGALSEHFRTRPGAIRSLHPIVSVTAMGRHAEAISGGAHFDGFGYDSPWGRLHRMNAKLMTLGMGHYPEMGLTFLHYMEHAYGVPYQYTKIYTTPVRANANVVPGPFTMSVRYLDFGITYDTNRFKEDLLAAGLGTVAPVGANSVFCTKAEDAMVFAIGQLRRDRYYFLRNPPRFRQDEIPMDGTTGEIQYVYDRAVPQGTP